MNIKLDMFHTLYIRNCCRSFDVVLAPCVIRQCINLQIGIFSNLFSGTEYHTATLSHCTKLVKSKDSYPNKKNVSAPRINLNGLFSPTA